MKAKHAKEISQNRLLIPILALIVILSICGGLIYHNHLETQKATTMRYTSKHFNQNVKIYGVKVGGLTVNQAVKKINQKAKIGATMTNGKIKSMKLDNVEVTNSKDIKKYFKKQHTDLPSSKSWNFADSTLATAKSKLAGLYKAKLDYKVGGKTYSLAAKDLFTTVEYYGGEFHFKDSDLLTKKLDAMDKEVTTLKKSYEFTTPSGSKITVKNESYGWGIFTKRAVNLVETAFANGESSVDGSKAIYGLGYTTYGTGYTTVNHGLGENYVVVSIEKQKLWIVRHGKVVVTLNDVVTGTKESSSGASSDATPKGVWYIEYKESPSTLRGQNDDGSSYASTVSYWMPFTLSGCGLHDASWRTDWSKTAYLKGGSHGCVNIKPSEIKKVWDNVIQHEPVIVY